MASLSRRALRPAPETAQDAPTGFKCMPKSTSSWASFGILIFSAERSHQSMPHFRTSVSFYPSLVALGIVRSMPASVSTLV